MSTTNSFSRENLSEEFIDRQVESQANDDLAWETPIQVNQQTISLSLPAELAAQAVFLASLEQEKDVKKWLIEIIREQLNHKLIAFAHSQQFSEKI